MEHHHQQQQEEVAVAAPPQFGVANSDGVHPTPVANPTPTQPQLASTHPSYAEMITEAIQWDSSQGKAGGSSKRAIAKYIDRVYSNLPPTHSALLTHHLKRLKNSGNLVMIKNSYQLPVVPAPPARSISPMNPVIQPHTQDLEAEAAAAGVGDGVATPRKRPGRPPKPKTEVKEAVSSSVVVGSNGSGKRPRGRPPRQQQPAVAEVPFVQPVSQPVFAGVSNGQETPKKRPGRPPKKQKQQHQFAQPVYEAQFETDNQTLAIVPVNGTVKRRPGRPPGAKNIAHSTVPPVGGPRPKGRGRPKRKAYPLGPLSRAVGKRPPGRPPRNPAAAPGVGVGVRAGGRGRGRPSKGGVSVTAGPSKLKPKLKPMRKYTGKPRGRPRKSSSVTADQSSEQVSANEEILKKVENMQTTVREAVGVLRPYLANENAAEVLLALQKLEDLSAMDIDTSPAPTEPPMTDMSVPEPENVSAPPEASITVPTTVDPPVVPFSITTPAMTETGPPLFAQPSANWIPSSEAQL